MTTNLLGRKRFITQSDESVLVKLLPFLSAPTALAATNLTVNSFTANWTAVSGALSYRLDVATDPGFANPVAAFYNLLVAGTSQSVTGLLSEVTYYYRVRALVGSEFTDNSNTVLTSTQGAWTAQVSAADNQWFGFAYSPSLRRGIACSITGASRLMVTDNGGITWYTQAGPDPTADWRDAIWIPTWGKFVLVAAAGVQRLALSATGLDGSWQLRTIPANPWVALAYSATLDRCIAASSDALTNQVIYSSDQGVTWPSGTCATAGPWLGATRSESLGAFCIVGIGAGNRAATSVDGITWTGRAMPEANTWCSVCPSSIGFCAVAIDGTNRVATSTTGVTWVSQSAVAANQWRVVRDIPGYGTVAASVSGVGNRVMSSINGGATWATEASAADNDWRDLKLDSDTGRIIAVASSGVGNRVMTRKVT